MRWSAAASPRGDERDHDVGEIAESFIRRRPCGIRATANIPVRSEPGTRAIIDSGSLRRAPRELKCDIIFKATKVDGILHR
jgi:hypothetical protein